MTMPGKCPVADCPAQYRDCGCGYLIAETPCRHPDWRDEWKQKKEEQSNEQ